MKQQDGELDQAAVEFMARLRASEEEMQRGVVALQEALNWVTEDEQARFSDGASCVRGFLRAMTGACDGECNIHALMCLLDAERSRWVKDIFVAAMGCQHPNDLWMAVGFATDFPDQRALELINDTDPNWSSGPDLS